MSILSEALQSETLREVGDGLDFAGNYDNVSILKKSPRGKIHIASRAGKRFLLKAAASDSAKDIESLKREYEMSMSLAHPNVVYVFTYESTSPVGPCIVMEYVDGVTLREWLSKNPSQSNRRRIFAQLLDAVEYLHKKGLLHNDLSPENILITRSDNSLKIIDFGFADDDTHYLGRERGCTRAYASPELLEGRPADARSDIYSLGVLMRDIFGVRYACVSRHACRKDADARYGSVAALRSAWTFARRCPHYIVGLLLALCLAYFAYDFIGMKKQMREAERVEKQRIGRLDILKERVNRYYEEEITPAITMMAAAPSYDEALKIWNGIIDNYNNFWRTIVDECPEESSAELINFIALKYNSDFPLPPSSSNRKRNR